MKRLTLAVLALAAMATVAQAACPAGTRYQCHPTLNGKMQCGCY